MANNDPIYIGEAVRRLRISKQKTQQELAEDSSLDLKSIHLIEKNIQEPKLSTLYALATAFDLDFMDFMKEVHHQFKTRG